MFKDSAVYGARDSPVVIMTRIRILYVWCPEWLRRYCDRDAGGKTEDSRQGKEIFLSSKRPHWLSGPHSLLFNAKGGHILRGKTTGALVCGCVPPLPLMPSWIIQEDFTFASTVYTAQILVLF